MVKSLLITALIATQTLAHAAPMQVMSLKDFKVTSVSNSKSELVYKGETISVERIGETHYKINGKDVIFKNTDTLDAVNGKIQTAYNAGGKKSAALDELFIPRAHAAPPLLFSLLFGGMIGAAIGNAAGQKQCEQQQSGNGNNAAPTYDSPVVQ